MSNLCIFIFSPYIVLLFLCFARIVYRMQNPALFFLSWWTLYGVLRNRIKLILRQMYNGSLDSFLFGKMFLSYCNSILLWFLLIFCCHCLPSVMNDWITDTYFCICILFSSLISDYGFFFVFTFASCFQDLSLWPISCIFTPFCCYKFLKNIPYRNFCSDLWFDFCFWFLIWFPFWFLIWFLLLDFKSIISAFGR